jgi:DNA-binding NtrC family response regulator
MAINKVLCVDDDVSWRKNLRMYFEKFVKANVDLAEDYKSALEHIHKNNYDLIILDGLEGDCFKIYEDIKYLPHGNVVIFSMNEKVENEAKAMEIPVYTKAEGLDGLDKIVAKYK